MSDTDSSRDATPVAPVPGPRAKLRPQVSLSRVQAIVGVTAGLLSITGFLYSLVTRPAATPVATTGDIVAIVQDARTARAVPGPTIEILTLKDALVTTLTPRDGRARQSLKEGAYRIRASHPRFGTEVRQIQVMAGQTAEIRLRLTPRVERSPHANGAVGEAGRAIDEGIDAVKRLFR